MEKHKYFNGKKFTRDEQTGYYLNSTIRKRLHRYVWEFHKGEIPNGYHIHHVDHDKTNNDIENLKAISASEHTSLHGTERGLTHYDELIKNLNENVRPKASEWHGSEEGRKWHSEHAKKMRSQAKQEELTCKQCNEKFKTTRYGNKKHFCSNNCKSKWRRKSGVDNEKRNCERCKKEFIANKYAKTIFCSRYCMKKSYWENRSV